MDRTHWFGCWEVHHECAMTRIEQLEKALVKIKSLSLDGMNMTKEFNTGLQFNQINFEAERMEERE